MKSFLIKTSILFLAIIAIGYVLYSQFIPHMYLPILPFALIFIYFLTNLIHSYLLKVANTNIKKFINWFMALNFSKMFIYLIFAVIYSFLHQENAKIFLINYLVFYIAFTFLEIHEIVKLIRTKS